MEKGFLALVLHAHLPYVRHPEHSYFLEEDWLYEAITETYIPLIDVFEGLVRDEVPFRVTLSLTPPLISMLTDGFLQQRYSDWLDKLLELSEKELVRTSGDPDFGPLARMYQYRLRKCRRTFDAYGRNIVPAFRQLQESGHLEILTSAATHAFLPLHTVTPEAVRAQVRVAVDHYAETFGTRPTGMWLPECGYAPGIDDYLAEVGIRYFITDFHGIMHANPRPRYGVYAPVYCESGVAAFGRDLESSKQVWSAREGYPGDGDYREFYRDIGHDLSLDYIGPYVQPNGLRKNTGFKYHRVTGKTMDKGPYNEWIAKEKAAVHAGNFMYNREIQARFLGTMMDRPPIIVSPYDAELFGHWWFEGPDWLNYLIRRIAYDQTAIELATPGDYLSMYPRNQASTPSASSWGHKGYNEVWLGGSNDWIYRHLHKASQRMSDIATSNPHAEGMLARALTQAARELLLAQSSDWAFIMKTGTMVPYAVKRTKNHLGRFTGLYEQVQSGDIDAAELEACESIDNIFPNLDYRVYARCEHAPGHQHQGSPLLA